MAVTDLRAFNRMILRLTLTGARERQRRAGNMEAVAMADDLIERLPGITDNEVGEALGEWHGFHEGEEAGDQ
jgi:hypothetical protein